jgi:hypothetical protein
MRLGEKQELFARLVPRLLNYAHFLGYGVRIGEVYRSPEEARRLAKLGKGIVNSNHCKKLAIDLFLSIDGKVTWDMQPYENLGDCWKELHELCRWGGDFKNRDGVHFSLEHNGVM